jgi:hypothetical protein
VREWGLDRKQPRSSPREESLRGCFASSAQTAEKISQMQWVRGGGWGSVKEEGIKN